jgi:very-short-patch-repair endonuclease
MRSRIIERNMFFGAGGKIFENARGLRKNMTFAERIMWDELKNRRQFKFRFRRQHPVDIFILDFYCHELKLAIEIDGDIHLEKEVAEYDDGRTHDIEKLGIKLLRFTNEQVKNCRSNVIKEILETIKNIKNNSVE